MPVQKTRDMYHPEGNPGENLKSFSHRCHPILVAFVWELTEETIDLPLGCLQGGQTSSDQLCESSGTKERLHGSLPDRTWRRRIPRHFWRVEIPEPGPLARCQERQLHTEGNFPQRPDQWVIILHGTSRPFIGW